MDVHVSPEAPEQARAARYAIVDRGRNRRMNLFVWGAVAILTALMVTLSIAGTARHHDSQWQPMVAFPFPVTLAVILVILLKFHSHWRRKTILGRLHGEQENLADLSSQFDQSLERLETLKGREQALK